VPLDRNIHWIGRQWAVTGHGMQLIDQKQKGAFDIEVSRLWDEALIEGLRAQPWANVADFEKGLEVARKRYPDPSRPVSPSPETMTVRAAPAAPVAPLVMAPPIVPSAPVPEAVPPLQVTKPAESAPQEPEAIESEKSAPRKFQMQFLGNAKFIRPWRVRMKR
jgi:hypothetical protein